MVLPIWDPERLRPRLPFNVALCGGRKQGKSGGVAHLLDLLKDEFQLVICMVGSAACNPVLEHLLKENWDPRFFFSEWDDELIGRLLKQQEELLGSGQQREVLIILDDVILSSKADDQLAHMAMRGRHFRISLMMCAVSYTTLPKRTRRSLDVLLVYSLPMQGDFKVLTYEYCQGSSSMARFALNQLREHECLVLETLCKKQSLFIWKAVLYELKETEAPQDPDESRTPDEADSELERPPDPYQKRISSAEDCTESPGDPARVHVV